MENDPEKPLRRRRPLRVARALVIILALALLIGLGSPPLGKLRATSEQPEPSTPLIGVVVDGETQAPIAGATIRAGQAETRTNPEGAFMLEPNERTATLSIKMAGYERRQVQSSSTPMTIPLRRQIVKAAYLTYYTLTDPTTVCGGGAPGGSFCLSTHGFPVRVSMTARSGLAVARTLSLKTTIRAIV